jgi:hypothetical protein
MYFSVELSINPFDVRKPCDDPDGMCYVEVKWIETWMNNAENKLRLGVPANVNFSSCNDRVHVAFDKSGDGMHNAGALFTGLLNDGIRLLVFSGNAGNAVYLFIQVFDTGLPTYIKCIDSLCNPVVCPFLIVLHMETHIRTG